MLGKRLINTTSGGGGLLNDASFYLNPRTIPSDGTITTWQDEGTIGRDFYAVGTVQKYGTGTSIEYVAGNYGTDSKLFAGSATPTAYSDYSNQQDITFGGFVNVPSGYTSGALLSGYANFYAFRPSHGGTTSYINELSTSMIRLGLAESYRVSFIARNGGSAVGNNSSTSTLEPFPSWHFICFTIDYNPAGTSTMKNYFDGVLEATTTFTGTYGSSSNVMSVGASYEDGTSFNRSGVFFGDSFGFMGTVKTDAEILEIYNTYKGFYGL